MHKQNDWRFMKCNIKINGFKQGSDMILFAFLEILLLLEEWNRSEQKWIWGDEFNNPGKELEKHGPRWSHKWRRWADKFTIYVRWGDRNFWYIECEW